VINVVVYVVNMVKMNHYFDCMDADWNTYN
jgi:hypothetical protein